MDDALTWNDTYAIARALIAQHPGVDLSALSLRTIFEWTLALPNFSDSPEFAHDDILMAIFQEWYEEVNPV